MSLCPEKGAVDIPVSWEEWMQGPSSSGQPSRGPDLFQGIPGASAWPLLPLGTRQLWACWPGVFVHRHIPCQARPRRSKIWPSPFPSNLGPRESAICLMQNEKNKRAKWELAREGLLPALQSGGTASWQALLIGGMPGQMWEPEPWVTHSQCLEAGDWDCWRVRVILCACSAWLKTHFLPYSSPKDSLTEAKSYCERSLWPLATWESLCSDSPSLLWGSWCPEGKPSQRMVNSFWELGLSRKRGSGLYCLAPLHCHRARLLESGRPHVSSPGPGDLSQADPGNPKLAIGRARPLLFDW